MKSWITAAVLLGATSAASAQTAPTGPLRMVTTAADRALMVVAPSELPGAIGPSEVWVWTFYDVSGEPTPSRDALATHYRIDCRRMELQAVYGELWLNGAFLRGSAVTPAAFRPDAGTTQMKVVESVCQSGQPRAAQTFADMASASAAVKAHFQRQPR